MILHELVQDTASPGYSQANEEIDALTEYDFKPDSKSREAHQTSVGCVGKSLTSSLRVIRGRKSRRNRHAVEASPTTGARCIHDRPPSTVRRGPCQTDGMCSTKVYATAMSVAEDRDSCAGSSSHNSTPAHCQPEQDATLASVDVKMSGFGFDNRFGQADSHMPQRCGGRRALDYGRQHRSSSGRDEQAQRTPQPAPQSGHSGVHDVRQRHDSMPASARSAERCGSVWQGTPGHTLPATDSRRLSGPGAREMRLDNGSLHARGRLTTLNEVERLEFASEPSTQPEVLFADTARSSEAQLPARGDDELCPGDPHSLDMARHALLRSTASGRANLAEAQAALQAGQPRRRLMSLLSISKQSTQRNLIPSSRSDQRCSATESEISGALHGLGNVLMSTSASVLQNPGELDHMDAFSKVDSTELVTMRGAPSHLVASCPVDSA